MQRLFNRPSLRHAARLREDALKNIDDRVASLIGKCSREAWSHLQQLLEHPKLPALTAQLEKIEGTLNETDIEQGLQRLLTGQPREN